MCDSGSSFPLPPGRCHLVPRLRRRKDAHPVEGASSYSAGQGPEGEAAVVWGRVFEEEEVWKRVAGRFVLLGGQHKRLVVEASGPLEEPGSSFLVPGGLVGLKGERIHSRWRRSSVSSQCLGFRATGK